jgi:CelD/BcsL family acetyltransferase involved in cellulose biosynthesis
MSRAHVEPFDVITIDDDEVVAQIPEWLSRLPMTNLYRVRRESPIMGYLDRQPRWTVTTTFNSSFVDLSSGLDAVKKQMGSKYLRELRRRRRRLAELGSIGFVEHRSGAEAEQLLLAGFELEAAGWKGDRGHAVLHEPTHERWYRSVTEVASDQGWLRVCGMYLDDRLIAFLYNLEIDGHRYGMATTYDESPDVSIYSPGALLHEMVFEKSAGEGVLSYQFGVGDDAWKYEWATDKRQVYDLLLFGAGPAGWALKKARSARQLIRG